MRGGSSQRRIHAGKKVPPPPQPRRHPLRRLHAARRRLLHRLPKRQAQLHPHSQTYNTFQTLNPFKLPRGPQDLPDRLPGLSLRQVRPLHRQPGHLRGFRDRRTRPRHRSRHPPGLPVACLHAGPGSPPSRRTFFKDHGSGPLDRHCPRNRTVSYRAGPLPTDSLRVPRGRGTT